MGNLTDLKATNGECIADFGSIPTKLRLHCVEELGGEYTHDKRYVSVWIPIDSKEFWTLIKDICNRNAKNTSKSEEIKRWFRVVSKDVEALVKSLENSEERS